MKFATDRLYADPEKAARKLVEIANATFEQASSVNGNLIKVATR
jgi:hypothetical protein